MRNSKYFYKQVVIQKKKLVIKGLKKLLKMGFTLAFGLVLITSCESGDKEDEKSSEKNVLGLTINSVEGTINQTGKTISVYLPEGTNLASISADIVVSSKASVSPLSGSVQDFSVPVVFTVTAEDGSTQTYTVEVTNQCVFEKNVYVFQYDGKKYELILEAKTWVDAAACALQRGAYLAEISSAQENAALFEEVNSNTSLDMDKTVASDGGMASYVWIGGNDLETEGTWIWDGNNDGSSVQFWQGPANGSAVNGLFTNWGNEPDDFDGQDCLGLALTDWPLGLGSLGKAGQWNDVDKGNELYFILEY